MMPVYEPGDLVYVKNVKMETIKPGMVLTFVANKDSLVVTHRVVEVNDRNRYFVTKGDANKNMDSSPVLYENVLGVVSFSIPKLGYISHYLSSKSGHYTVITILFLLIFLLVLQEIFPKHNTKVHNAQKKKDNKFQKECFYE